MYNLTQSLKNISFQYSNCHCTRRLNMCGIFWKLTNYFISKELILIFATIITWGKSATCSIREHRLSSYRKENLIENPSTTYLEEIQIEKFLMDKAKAILEISLSSRGFLQLGKQKDLVWTVENEMSRRTWSTSKIQHGFVIYKSIRGGK